MQQKFEHIEGPRACIEAIRNNVPVKKIYVGGYVNLKNNKNINRCLTKAKSLDINVKYVDKKLLDQKSERGNHQGIICEVKPYQYSSLKEILHNCSNKSASLIVVLDHIVDSGNLGAIARSAEAFGADGLIIPNKRAANISAQTYKSSAGAICKISIAKVANITAALKELKQNDYWVAGASEHSDKPIWDENLNGKIALVMGAEHNGLSQLVQKNCDFICKLPLNGSIESLNVAQAFTACAYEWVRQNH